jgi:tryptophan synthase beta subunit
MSARDMERQALNVYRMRLLGAQVHGVETGTAVLKDAVSETFREGTRRIADTHYVIGSCTPVRIPPPRTLPPAFRATARFFATKPLTAT